MNLNQFHYRKYFIGKILPADLCNNPSEVQRLVEKMDEFDNILQQVHEDLNNPTKKLKKKLTNFNIEKSFDMNYC